MHSKSLSCGYCCAMLPDLSVVQDVTVIQRRRKYPDVFWLDVPVVILQSGGSDSVQCYEVQKHFHWGSGRGEVKSPVHMRPRIGFLLLLFVFFTVKAEVPCSQACCPERRGVCCSRGRCCPEPGNCWSRPHRPGRWWRRTVCSPDEWSDAHPRPQIRRPSGSVRPRPSRPGRRQRQEEVIYKPERNEFENRRGFLKGTLCSDCPFIAALMLILLKKTLRLFYSLILSFFKGSAV